MQAARLLALLVLVSPACCGAQTSPAQTHIAPPSSAAVQRFTIPAAREPVLAHDAKLKLLREKVKYVFVLFQENRSFDFYFSTYPGADGLYSHPAASIAGFTQPIVNLDGTVGSVSPFKIPFSVVDANGKTVPLYPSDITSVNHSHVGIAHKLDIDANGVARNDRYALTEEGVTLENGKPSKIPSLERKQFGELVMSHVDCDAAPFMWSYADRFTLFDHFMDTVIGPSTPNAIAMISGQSGETQWMLHPDAVKPDGSSGNPMPMLSDPAPYWGSFLDTKGDHPRQPIPIERISLTYKSTTDPRSNPASNLTFASLPLSFMGADIQQTTAADYDPAFDLLDVRDDIRKIAGHGIPATNWGWYQQGYDHEPTDAAGAASHDTYVVHHNAPQYFGYVANNPLASTHLHGLSEFFTDIAARRLPSSGVFYLRGGYGNIRGWKPQDPNPKLADVYSGNDDHPGYSDTQISEGLLAEEINAIAASPYWSQSAIIITYDESDGLYDHAQPRIRSHDANGLPLEQGPRIPAIVISPYAVAHGVSHVPWEHSSIIKFVDELFGLIPLADLPDEMRARQIGVEKFGQANLGPADDKVEGVGDMSSAFDTLRLEGKRPALSAEYATIPPAEIAAFPHAGGAGCKQLEITPTDRGLRNPVPADFNPRPDTTPGVPSAAGWTP